MTVFSEMQDFLSWLTTSLRECRLVEAKIYPSMGDESKDSIEGTVESLAFYPGGKIAIEVSSSLGLTTWQFSQKSPCLEKTGGTTYKLYNETSYLEICFA